MREPMPNDGATKVPSRHQKAVLTWIVAYPLITFLLAILEPLVGELPMPIRTFVLSVLMVPAMVYWAVPTVVGFYLRKMRALD